MALEESAYRWLVAWAVIFFGFLAYANTLTGEFVWDDASSVLLHKTVQDPSKFFQLFREDQHAYGRGQGNFYRPLAAASFMADFALAYDGPKPPEGVPDVSPFLFHLTNIFWHVLAALLLFAVMTRLEVPQAVRAVMPLLYALHPLHTEAVAYISGRADSMAAAFMFAGLWCGLSKRPVVAAAFSFVFFVAALLSKESASIFPVLLALCLWLRPTDARPSGVHAVAVLAPIIAGLAVYWALRATVLRFAALDVAAASPLATRLVESLQAFALYVRLIFAPTGLHMERTLAGVPVYVAAIGALLLAACVGIVVYGLRSKRPRAALGMSWFLATWAPISGIFPLNAPMAEHWLYVPLAGFLWAAAELAWPMVASHAALRRVAGVIVAVWGAWLLGLTVDRNLDWRDNEALYTATLRANPDSLRVRYNLAVTYDDLVNNPVGAKREYEALIERYARRVEQGGAADFDEGVFEARIALGRLYYEDDDVFRAQEHFRTALQMPAASVSPDIAAEAAFGLARCYLRGGDVEAARDLFQKASEVRPDLAPEAQRLLAAGPGAK